MEGAHVKDAHVENAQVEDAQVEDAQGKNAQDAHGEDAQEPEGAQTAQVEDALVEDAQVGGAQVEKAQVGDAQVAHGEPVPVDTGEFKSKGEKPNTTLTTGFEDLVLDMPPECVVLPNQVQARHKEIKLDKETDAKERKLLKSEAKTADAKVKQLTAEIQKAQAAFDIVVPEDPTQKELENAKIWLKEKEKNVKDHMVKQKEKKGCSTIGTIGTSQGIGSCDYKGQRKNQNQR